MEGSAAAPFFTDEEAAEQAAGRERRARAAAMRSRARNDEGPEVVPATVSNVRAARGPTKKAAKQAEHERWAAEEAAAGPPAPRRAAPAPSSSSSPAAVGGVTVADASGFMLALLTWSWVVLPYLKGGPGAVTDVWRAKFLNKGPDGNELM